MRKEGRVLSPEHKAKISAAKKGRVLSPEVKAFLLAAKEGKKRKPFSPEHKANLSKVRKIKEAAYLEWNNQLTRKKPHIEEVFAAFQRFGIAQIQAANSIRDPGIRQKQMDEATDALEKFCVSNGLDIDFSKRED